MVCHVRAFAQAGRKLWNKHLFNQIQRGDIEGWGVVWGRSNFMTLKPYITKRPLQFAYFGVTDNWHILHSS